MRKAVYLVLSVMEVKLGGAMGITVHYCVGMKALKR